MRELFLPDKNFRNQVLKTAGPIAFQNISVSLLSLMDTAIIKSLGEGPMGAVSLANQLTFLTNNMTFGLSSGASVYLSRYHGERNGEKIRETLFVSVFSSLCLNLAVALFAILLPGRVMGIMTDHGELIQMGGQYLRLSAVSYLCMAVSYSMTALFRSIGKAHYVLVPTCISLGLKTLLNFLLVHGAGIFPALGIAGAGIATVVSKAVELSVYLVLYSRTVEPSYKLTLSRCRDITFAKCRSFLKKTYAVVLNESLWAVGLSMFSIIFGRMAVTEISALNIAKTLEELFNSLFYGVAISAVVILGADIGAGRMEEAKRNAKRFLILGAETGLVILVVMAAAGGMIVDRFFGGLLPETRQTAKILILEFAVYMPFRSAASAAIMGVMRAGGESRRAMVYDVLPVYAWSLPVGFLLGMVFHLPMAVVLPAMYFKRVIKAFFSLRRVLQGKWLNRGEPADA